MNKLIYVLAALVVMNASAAFACDDTDNDTASTEVSSSDDSYGTASNDSYDTSSYGTASNDSYDTSSYGTASNDSYDTSSDVSEVSVERDVERSEAAAE